MIISLADQLRLWRLGPISDCLHAGIGGNQIRDDVRQHNLHDFFRTGPAGKRYITLVNQHQDRADDQRDPQATLNYIAPQRYANPRRQLVAIATIWSLIKIL